MDEIGGRTSPRVWALSSFDEAAWLPLALANQASRRPRGIIHRWMPSVSRLDYEASLTSSMSAASKQPGLRYKTKQENCSS